ncbi:MAG: hypothetical protein QNI87_03300 [Erythrobacter sp.]|uniref:phage holin family protein n=1 Tax=Erythrobacter sp. TaxID=1042 RepID=UPI00262B98D3|nr:hypothetical protein [Erythrobacter sp.]MDJ0977538.1 hypothetical protein [Erythrobacter sp.]
MLDKDQGRTGADAEPSVAPAPDPDRGPEGSPDSSTAPDTDPSEPAPLHDETIIEELGALIDDAGLYATAELAFQKTRAKLVGRSVGIAALAVVLALILFHIAVIALAVGFVIALAPFVTIWGAIAIVVGLLLLGVGALVYIAISRGRLVGEMFESPPSDAALSPDAQPPQEEGE